MAISKYEKIICKNLPQVVEFAAEGLNNTELAAKLGIKQTVFYEYMNKYPEFAEAVQKGKELATENVVNALYQSAINGNVAAQIFWLKNRRPDKWRDKIEYKGENELRERITIIDDIPKQEQEYQKENFIEQ